MPISGPVVHRQLMAAYTDSQARLEAARGEISQAKEHRDDLTDERGDALVRLAEHYLPELTPETVRETWVEIRPKVSQILLSKEEHRRRLQESLTRITADRQLQEGTLLRHNEQLDQALDEQHQMAEAVEQRLQTDSHFVELSDRAAIAEAALERAEANLHEIDQDSAKKLPAYDDSSLFRYLHDRGYGTPQYAHRGLTRRMDRWLARYIGYQDAIQGYEFLRRTPEEMRKVIAEDRMALDTVMQELERIRDEAADAAGLLEKIRESGELRQKRDAQLQVLDKIRLESEQVQHELTDLEDTRGPFYRQAVSLFREMLEQTDSRDLKQIASETPEITDDQIVARMLGIKSEIDQLDDRARQRRQQLGQLQEFLDGLGRLIQRFRASGFDSARSQFVGSLDVVEELLESRDKREIDDLWQQIRKSQRWGPTVMERVTHVAAHPLTQVLINAMASAAGAAMQNHASRAGRRRSKHGSNWIRQGDWKGWTGDSSGSGFWD